MSNTQRHVCIPKNLFYREKDEHYKTMSNTELIQSVTAILLPLKSSLLLDQAARHVLQDMFLKGHKARYVGHDAFTYGVSLASDALDDYEEDETFTLNEVIEKIKINLSWKRYDREYMMNTHLGWETPDYAYRVGFTYEWFHLLVEHEMISDLADFLPDDGGDESALKLPLAA